MKELRELTSARVSLGRAGNSLPMRAMLDFQLAHARAQDAVHCPFNPGIIPDVLILESAARDRAEYLRRPDLGRRLSERSRQALREGTYDAVFVVSDGLSALAAERHAPELLKAILPRLEEWRVAPIVACERGRVAIGDEIGERLGASLTVMLIGERPGLSSPDSLGAYLTWAPCVGRTDAERNCISNIRPEGLAIGAAAELLLLLMTEARSHRLSGVTLKTEQPRLAQASLVYLGLGSNLGDRAGTLQSAIERLQSPELRLVRLSSVRETEPVGLKEQPRFLNQVAEFETTFSPEQLLERTQTVERELGRVRTVLNGPRTIDIDIVLYGSLIVKKDGLEVPHPRFRERSFVLEPLVELCPDLSDPITGLTIRELDRRNRLSYT